MSATDPGRGAIDGAAVGVIAPASTMADLPAAIRSVGVNNLARLEYRTKLGANVDNRHFHTAGTLAERLSDLYDALEDPEVAILMPVFGGYNSNQLLHRIDYDRVAASNKPLIGYSDITAMLLAMGRLAGTPVFHGPSFSMLCDPNLFDYAFDGMRRTLAGEPLSYAAPAQVAADHWYLKSGFGPREPYEGRGWAVYREGDAQGPLIGGNLDTLCAIAGTRYFPEPDGCLLFVEDATGKSPGTVHRGLTQLQQLGVFDRISGFIFGSVPRDTALDDHNLITEILADTVGSSHDYPVTFNVNCSHVDPVMTLPLFRTARLTTSPEPALRVNLDATDVTAESIALQRVGIG